MTKHAHVDSEHTHVDVQVAADAVSETSGLPNGLMTAFEVAEYVGCHEETVRRAYWRGLLPRNASASEEGGSIPQTSSTGSVEAHPRECPN
jgi:hypothetical protein